MIPDSHPKVYQSDHKLSQDVGAKDEEWAMRRRRQSIDLRRQFASRDEFIRAETFQAFIFSTTPSDQQISKRNAHNYHVARFDLLTCHQTYHDIVDLDYSGL